MKEPDRVVVVQTEGEAFFRESFEAEKLVELKKINIIVKSLGAKSSGRQIEFYLMLASAFGAVIFYIISKKYMKS